MPPAEPNHPRAKFQVQLRAQIRRLESQLELLRDADLEVLNRAVSAFDGLEPAVTWLTQPQPFCSGKTPLQWTRTARGRKEVMAQLVRIDFGVYA